MTGDDRQARGFVHCATGALARGPARVLVGFCRLYEEGDTALLTIDQPGGSLVEVALTRSEVMRLLPRLAQAAMKMSP